MWNNVFFLVLLFILGGCAAKPPQRFNYDQNTNIGIVNILETEITHSYLGVTIFSNFEKKYEVDWDIPSRMTNRFILKSNANVKVLEPPSWFKENPRELTSQSWNSYGLNKKHYKQMTILCEANDVDVVIFISSFTGPRGESNFSADFSGYGIFTQGFMGNNFAQGYMNVSARAVNCDPLTYTVWSNASQANRIFDYTKPKNDGTLPQSEIAKAKSIIESRSDHIIDTIISKLRIEKPLIY